MSHGNYSMKNSKWKDIVQWLLVVLELALIVAIVSVVIAFLHNVGLAEGEDQRWVMCQPDSFVNVRQYPRMNGGYMGRLELGDQVTIDGQEKNGFLHIIGFGESNEGWVSKRYLTDSPVTVKEGRAWIYASGKVAVRKFPGGPRLRWMKPGAEVTLYAWSDEWAITDRGFIKIRFLECE